MFSWAWCAFFFVVVSLVAIAVYFNFFHAAPPKPKPSEPTGKASPLDGKRHITFIRHAEPKEVTPEEQYNPGLTDKGHEQARALKGDYDLVIVSPMQRAQETLASSQISSKKKITHVLFREWKIYGRHCLIAGEDDSEMKEDEAAFRARLRVAWSFLDSRPERNIAVVAHGGFNSYMLHSKGVDRRFAHADSHLFECPKP